MALLYLLAQRTRDFEFRIADFEKENK